MKSIWNFKRYILENGVTPILIARFAIVLINLFLLLCCMFRWFLEVRDTYMPDIPGIFFGIVGIATAWTSRKFLQYLSIVITIIFIAYFINILPR